MTARIAVAAILTLAACGTHDDPPFEHTAPSAPPAVPDGGVDYADPTTTTTTVPATTTTHTHRPRVRSGRGHVHPNPAPGIAEASWYGPGFYGNRTACGHTYTDRIHGTAHRTLPCGTLVTFTNAGRSVTVPVIDRGPFIPGRMWDLSYATCQALAHCYTGPIQWRLA